MTTTEFINGPVNTFRLEGKINNINKIVYLFGDYHLDLNNQTECDNFRSTDIRRYFVDQFDYYSKTNSKLDFFLEVPPSMITKLKNDYYPYRVKYIWGVSEFFSRLFTTEKGRVTESPEFPNVRLHYSDIRDYIYDLNSQDVNSLYNYVNEIETSKIITIRDIDLIKNSIQIIGSRLIKLIDLFITNFNETKQTKPVYPENIENLSNMTNEDYNNIAERLIYKLKSKYVHPEIKNIINNIINSEIIPYLKYEVDFLSNILDLLNTYPSKIVDQNTYTEYKKTDSKNIDDAINQLLINNYGTPNIIMRKMIYDLSNNIDKFYNINLSVFSMIMDIYFLRRFLDKDYITKAINYSGMSHTISYLYYLVKYFNFTITHASNVNINDSKNPLDNLNKIIKKLKYKENLFPYVENKYLIQCSDLSHFPKKFN